MRYRTSLSGSISVDKPLDDKFKNILNGLNKTKRMQRDVSILANNLNISVKTCTEMYGEDGQFYFNLDNQLGQTHTDDIINYNEPPSGQPSLWCGWRYNEGKNIIEWDGSRRGSNKFDEYIEWITYIKDLLSTDYILNGRVDWFGEERADKEAIILTNNNIIRIRNWGKCNFRPDRPISP